MTAEQPGMGKPFTEDEILQEMASIGDEVESMLRLHHRRRRVAAAALPASALAQMIGVPEGMEIIGIQPDPTRQALVLIVRGDHFPEVEEGAEVPFIEISSDVLVHERTDESTGKTYVHLTLQFPDKESDSA